jgi:hypothetical protein
MTTRDPDLDPRPKALRQAVYRCGGFSGLARKMAEAGSPISSAAVQAWRRVPVSRARYVSQVAGIPLYELRPDVWDAPAPGAAAPGAADEVEPAA